LLLIAFTWIGLTDRQSGLAASALRITAVLAAVVGLIVFVVAGRTITGPLERLQQAMRDVATGDLSVHVEVDEAGEIGHVQAGFNNMLSGLAALESDNERLQAELRDQLDEVRASRTRIVEAADAERARIERNLHDGAQQRLLALSFALRGIERKVADNPGLEGDVRVALSQLDTAMSELRELARGIHPAILDDEGLGPALGSLAERATVPTTVNAPLNGRLPAAVEVTAFFVVAESLANVAKYADASQATVEAIMDGVMLRVEVADDGRGGADPRNGSGLRGLADRVAALGGELTIESPHRGGTRVHASIPVRDT
jgi:signal transduction histidine kinase